MSDTTTAQTTIVPMQSSECQDAYHALLQEQTNRLKRAKKWSIRGTLLFSILLTIFVACVGWENAQTKYEGTFLILFIGAAFSLVGIIASLSGTGLTRQQYYSLPGSSTAEHAHVCIHCGHFHEKACFRMRNSGAWHYCTNCNEQLWYDHPF